MVSNVLSSDISAFELYLSIYENYLFFKKHSLSILRVSEQFSPNITFSIGQIIENTFISNCKAKFSKKNLVETLSEQLQVVRNDHNCVLRLKKLSKLIELIYFDERKDLIEDLNNTWTLYMSQIFYNSDEEFIEKIENVLEEEIWILRSLFQPCISIDVIKTIYDIVIQSTKFNNALVKMSSELNLRNTSLSRKIYKIINMYMIPDDVIIIYYSQAIDNALNNEPTELSKMMETLDFYIKHVNTELLPPNQNVLNNFQKSSINYVNKDQYATLNSVARTLNQCVSKNEPINQFFQILKRMSCKTEFELYHSRAATRRLLPPSIQSIERESKVIKQLHEISNNFQFRELSIILRESRVSLELISDLSIQPCLFIPLAVWPYKPPYYNAVHMQEFANNIREKYLERFPKKQVQFPIISWQITLKDNIRNSKIIGNGIQAEVLLEVSKKGSITKDSLSPQIPDKVLQVALDGLCSSKAPILEKDSEGVYRPSNKKIPSSIKLQFFNFVADKSVSSIPKQEALNACITRILKRNREMRQADLIKQVIDEMKKFFSATEKDVKEMMTNLADRLYIKLNDDMAIYLP